MVTSNTGALPVKYATKMDGLKQKAEAEQLTSNCSIDNDITRQIEVHDDITVILTASLSDLVA